MDENITAKKKETKRRRRKKNAQRTIPPEIAADPELVKYWAQRYRLFSRFDEGIKLDRGGFSTECADLVMYPRIYPNLWSFLQFINNFLKGGALLSVSLHPWINAFPSPPSRQVPGSLALQKCFLCGTSLSALVLIFAEDLAGPKLYFVRTCLETQ